MMIMIINVLIIIGTDPVKNHHHHDDEKYHDNDDQCHFSHEDQPGEVIRHESLTIIQSCLHFQPLLSSIVIMMMMFMLMMLMMLMMMTVLASSSLGASSRMKSSAPPTMYNTRRINRPSDKILTINCISKVNLDFKATTKCPC